MKEENEIDYCDDPSQPSILVNCRKVISSINQLITSNCLLLITIIIPESPRTLSHPHLDSSQVVLSVLATYEATMI